MLKFIHRKASSPNSKLIRSVVTNRTESDKKPVLSENSRRLMATFYDEMELSINY